MKNLLKLAVAFALVLSMTACSGESKTEDYEVNDPQQNIQQDGENLEDDTVETPEEPEISEDPAEPTEPEEPIAPEVPEEPTSEPESPAEDLTNEEAPFDTSWASNAYEKLIPQPPFEGWTGEMVGNNVYEISTSQAKEGDSLEYFDVFRAYLDSLESLGFSIDGEVYGSTGYDEFGNEFEFKCGDGWAWITFYPIEDLSGVENDSASANSQSTPFDTSWASNEFELQVAKPAFESWSVSEFVEGSSWKIFVQDVHYDEVKDYASDLRFWGFALNESVDDSYSGLAYIFDADNVNGYHANIIFEAGDQSGMGSFSLKISK